MKKILLFTVFSLLTLFILYFLNFSISYFFISSLEFKKVSFIIDGDTFKTENSEKIRLIGIDAPEKGEKCYEESRKKLKELIDGKIVRVEKDKKDKDDYGRLLRYVFINETFVNLVLVKEGYAYVFMDGENIKYLKELIEAEKFAKENKVGCLWKN